MPWAVLRESLRGQVFEALAVKLMTGSHAQTEGEIKELRAELRGVLNRMLVEQLKLQEKEAIEAVRHDPAALERYRALFKRRTELELNLQRVAIQ